MEMGMEKESSLYTLNNIRAMEVIDINSGSRLGYIKDFVVDCEDYKVLSIIIPTQKLSWFNKENILEIEWNKVKKIGVDVILVDGSDAIIDEEE